MKHFRKIFISIICIYMCTLTFSQVLGTYEKDYIEINDIETLSDLEKETLDLINEERLKQGLSPLNVDKDLVELARTKANDLVDNDYFAHCSENYGSAFDMIAASNISYQLAGENLAGNISPEKAIESWINSKSHKENMLNGEYEYTGIAVVTSEKYKYVFVQMFIGQ